MKAVFILSILLFVLQLQAETVDTVLVKSKITDVTVFTEGAQVNRQASEKFIKGKHILVFERLPRELESQSIQVKNIDNCKILSVKHYLSNSNEKKDKAGEKAIQEKIDKLEFRIKEINVKLNVFAIEQKLLIDNSYLARKNEGSAVSEIKEAADYYRLRLTEIKQEELLLEKEYDEIRKKMQDLYVQMNELIVDNTTTWSKIYIAIECEKEQPLEIIFSYFVNSAGWEPMYDFRVDDISKPLNIVYNASIYQSSGEDWNNVNIKLSTSSPKLTGEKPELNAWYIERRNSYESKPIRGDAAAIRGRVVDKENGDPLPYVNVVIEQNNVQVGGSVTDINGNYLIKPITPGTYNIKASFVGFKTAQVTNIPLRSALLETVNVEMESSATELQAVTITRYQVPLIEKDRTYSGGTVTSEEISKMPSRNASGIASNVGGVFSQDGEVGNVRGQRAGANTTYVEGIRIRGSASLEDNGYRSSASRNTSNKKTETDYEITDFIANTLRTNITNLEYTIEIPYSIPSDGADYSIKIKEVRTPVQYIYYAVPKVDNEVFLTAEILDWTQLNLLSGKSSIYFQGTFTGESYIDASQTNDTLHISLGRDNNILVKREGNKTSEKKIIGNNIKETSGWDYTVKNNRTVPVKVVIEDQYPISERKAIEIELIESSGAKVDPKTGKMTWEFSLNPDEKKTFTSKYSVKYPRYEGVSVN
jgi:hypothetical protein